MRPQATRHHPARGARRIGLAVLVAFTLSACSLPNVNLESIARIAATPYAGKILPTATVAPATLSTAALVRQRSKLRVGIRFDAPPVASVNSEGQIEGLDVDIAREFAHRWLGSPDNVEFVQVTSASAPHKVERREVDLALGGLIHSRAAESYADFSLTYMQDGDALLIRTGSYADFAGLAQRTVTYVDATSTYALRDAQNASRITVTLQSAQSFPEALQDLRDGRTEAVAGRWRRLRAESALDPSLSVLTVFAREPVAVMIPQNDSDWADLVNLTLSAMMADGTFAKAYFNWYGEQPDAVQPLGDTINMSLDSLPETITPRSGLEQVRSSLAVRIGFNAQSDPLATLDEGGNPVGFEVDICRELARRWFQNFAAAQFTAMTADQIQGALQSETIDLAVGFLPQTQATERQMDFSQPVYPDGLGLAVLNGSAATELASLNGGSIGVVQNTTDQAVLDAAKAARNVQLNVAPFPDLATAVGALRGGQVVAIAADQVTLLALARASSDVVVLPERLDWTPIGIALPTNDSGLRDLVNLTLQEMQADGTYAQLWAKWFGDRAVYTIESWPGQGGQSTALVAPTPTPLPTLTPVIVIPDTPTPAPIPPTEPPPPPADTPVPQP
jgi:ABC-type amino acid transport substrate-binding protein